MSDEKLSAKGTYLLLASLDQPTPIGVGRLGVFTFPGGWYIYVGSALGSGGLKARLDRHRRRNKRLHWHIDYLLQRAEIEASWTIRSAARLECVLAARVCKLPQAQILVPRFGASDCRCAGHLTHVPYRPSVHQIEEMLAQRGWGAMGVNG
jgi:Uri superfamily endonuclease